PPFAMSIKPELLNVSRPVMVSVEDPFSPTNSRELEASVPTVVVVTLPETVVVILPRLLNTSVPVPNAQVVLPLVAISPAVVVVSPAPDPARFFGVSLPAVKFEVPDVCHDCVPVLLNTELDAPERLTRPRIVLTLLMVTAPVPAVDVSTARSDVRL